MDCRLQVFKRETEDRNSTTTYKFAAVDYSRAKSSPANFVCMLPAKIDFAKGKSANVFGGLFGDKSEDFAKELLNKALKSSQSNAEVKTEIERRLKLIDPKQAGKVLCGECKKAFQPRKMRKHKQNLCPGCLNKRFAARRKSF